MGHRSQITPLPGGVNFALTRPTVDQKRGLVFPIRLQLSQKSIRVEGKYATLAAGMSVTAEVVTGRRRVIDCLWSPVAKATGEAGRER